MGVRADGINPRTGIVVAICSVFLVFGFMFTVSGMKGERLGRVPLIALGPAICMPGVAAIFVARKTHGCTRWPSWLQRLACREKETAAVSPSLFPALPGELWGNKARSGEDSVSSTTTVGESSRLIRSVEQEELMRYLRACYPTGAFSASREVSNYCALDRLCAARGSVAYTAASGSMVNAPRDSFVVFSTRRDSTPYSSYCCYVSPPNFRWGDETMV